jgi:hypothetical protein
VRTVINVAGGSHMYRTKRLTYRYLTAAQQLRILRLHSISIFKVRKDRMRYKGKNIILSIF